MPRTLRRIAAGSLSILALLGLACSTPRVEAREIPRPTEDAARRVIEICGGETIRQEDFAFCFWIRQVELDQGWDREDSE